MYFRKPDCSAETNHGAAFINTFAFLCAIATSIIALTHPFGDRSGLGTLAPVCWIVTQSFVLVAAGWLISRVGVLFRWRWTIATGCVTITLVPTVVLLDAIAFGWMQHRLLSHETYRVALALPEGLWKHLSAGTVRGAIWLSAGWVLGLVTLLLVSWWTQRSWWGKQQRLLRRDGWFVIAMLPCLLLAIPAMNSDSKRNPFGVFLIAGLDSKPTQTLPLNATEKNNLQSAIIARQHRQRQLGVLSSSKGSPDVLIVVVESFRHELVCDEVMPHLTRFANRGIHCRNHFSGGNATNHGMFSLLNGLEAVWYESEIRYAPILNRLMRQSGYELGFFAGHDDWNAFRMDGFISPEQFDVFQIGEQNGLDSDRIATQRAASFLNRSDVRGDVGTRAPRLAMLYLYATHADYRSYPEDQVFQPAADDQFLIPFTSEMRDRVWNRYKNSARSIDRFLSAVMKEDRVVIVTGDHGESFLEDGTCGHGAQISKYQNMTPAVIYYPGGVARDLLAPTMHADLLPTLMSIVGTEISDSRTLDGVRLNGSDDSFLQNRVFAIRNYLNDDVALIVSSENSADSAFAYQGEFTIRDGAAMAADSIDESGQPTDHSSDSTAKWWKQWLMNRFQQ